MGNETCGTCPGWVPDCPGAEWGTCPESWGYPVGRGETICDAERLRREEAVEWER